MAGMKALSGTSNYWVAPEVKCVVKREYRNSLGARTTGQLVSYKGK